MQHITVLNNRDNSDKVIDYTPLIIGQAHGALTSLIDAFNKKDFGYDTTFKTALNIRKFQNTYIKYSGKQSYIDSSGYSIIRGDVARWDIAKVIDCYHQYLDHERQNYDNIFSLDIPFNKKYHLFNTHQNIKDFNHLSLSNSKKLLEEDPLLADKFYFIYQFKTKEHYEIWNKLYNDLELGKFIKNWSLGGMVSLKTMAHISFSPFIGMSFRCFFDYINSVNPNPTFKLHFLGIYQRTDRFQIAFIEKLIQSYLNSYADTLFTYDSINYIRQAQMNKNLEVFDFNNGVINKYSLNELPVELIKRVYVNDIYCDHFCSEIEQRKCDKPLNNTNVFAPLSIYSNVAIDKFFEHIIEQEDMIDLFKDSISVDHVGIKFKKVFKKLRNEKHSIFTTSLTREIIKNLQITFEFHKWYRDKRDKDSLHNLVLGFIKIINIKDMIKQNVDEVVKSYFTPKNV